MSEVLHVQAPLSPPRPTALASAPVSTMAPSISLPLRFVITGFLSLFTGVTVLVARPDILTGYHYNQYVVAVTHIFVLGFLCSIVMGAMYQLVPVALEARLHSERMAKWQFAVHAVGFVGMVWMFWRWDMKQVGHFGSVFGVGVALFVYNIGRTLRRVPQWNVVATGVTSGLVWLSVGVLAGLIVAAGKGTYDSTEAMPTTNPLWSALKLLQAIGAWVNGFDALGVMHAHAHAGVVGFFIMMIVSVSYKLVPMFTLSEIQSERRAAWSIRLLNAGVACLLPALALRSGWKLAAGLVVAAGLSLYLAEIGKIFGARRRRTIDWGLRYYVTALGILVLTALLGLVLGWPGLPVTVFTSQLETVYGWLGIVGVVTFTVLGFLYKIVPFLVWYRRYSGAVGRAKVPNLADLYSEHLQIAGYWTFLAGMSVAGLGAAFGQASAARAGAALVLGSLGIFGWNLGLMLRHLVRRRIIQRGASNLATAIKT